MEVMAEQAGKLYVQRQARETGVCRWMGRWMDALDVSEKNVRDTADRNRGTLKQDSVGVWVLRGTVSPLFF